VLYRDNLYITEKSLKTKKMASRSRSNSNVSDTDAPPTRRRTRSSSFNEENAKVAEEELPPKKAASKKAKLAKTKAIPEEEETVVEEKKPPKKKSKKSEPVESVTDTSTEVSENQAPTVPPSDVNRIKVVPGLVVEAVALTAVVPTKNHVDKVSYSCGLLHEHKLMLLFIFHSNIRLLLPCLLTWN
jgi:hypothetical protein